MSGPGSTPEHPDDGPPLTGAPGGGDVAPGPDQGHGQARPTPTRGANPFAPHGPTAPDDAEAQANLDADRHEGEVADDPDTEPKPSRIAPLLAAARTAIVGLLARLRPAPKAFPEEIERDVPPATEPAEGDAEGDAEPTPEPRRAPRWSPAGWSWETRVGVAAVISFVVLVGVFVTRKGSGGRPTPVVALPTEADPKKTGEAKVAKAEAGTPQKPAGGDSPPRGEVAVQPVVPGAHPVEPQTAPTATPTDLATTGKGVVTPATDPLHPPETVGMTTLPSLGQDLTSPTADNATTPPAMATTPGDSPSLPTIPGTEAKVDESRPPEPDNKVVEADTRPPEPEKPPEPAAVPVVDPAAVATTPPPDPKPEPEQPPTSEPAVVATPEPAVAPAVAAAPLQREKPKQLETVPALVPDGGAAAPGVAAGWVVIPSGGKRPGAPSSGDPGSGDDGSSSRGDSRGGRPRVADGPPIREDPTPGQAEPTLHTVQEGENLWTISKQYYNSGRYYKALQKANAAQVPDVNTLFIGTVLRIPPPEALDRSLVELPRPGRRPRRRRGQPDIVVRRDGGEVRQPRRRRCPPSPADPPRPPPRPRPARRGAAPPDLQGQGQRHPPEHRPRHPERQPAVRRDLQPQPRPPRRPQGHPHPRDHPDPPRGRRDRPPRPLIGNRGNDKGRPKGDRCPISRPALMLRR